jgi:hypothetical protein
MILNGSQRGGARDLAVHLLRSENEHVEVYEIRGFVAGTLTGALREAEAISRGTQCRKFLYSLSLSPPDMESVPVSVFEDALVRIEEKLGLVGHPRVIVFHEKQGRRHAHCVWSRINAESMTAVRMSHDRHKLTDVSRDLYFEHGWKMPQGLIDPELRNPLNFDRHEWFKMKRTGRDPRDIKAAFRQCWAASDSSKAFRQALEQRGYFLAQGDRRAVVAIDLDGEVYAVARWTGLRSKEVVARVGDIGLLPLVTETQAKVTALVQEKIAGFATSLREEFARAANELEARRFSMVQRHRQMRAELLRNQNERQLREARERSERFRRGLLGLWDRVTGTHAKLLQQCKIEVEAAQRRDAEEKDHMIGNQLVERQELQREILITRRQEVKQMALIARQLTARRPPPHELVATQQHPKLPSDRRRRLVMDP